MSAKPIPVTKIYQRTAQRLNLPEQYIKDAVEYYYDDCKNNMYKLSNVVFYLHGLGRFLIRPLNFWKRKDKLEQLVEQFSSRRDERGIMIRKELEERYKYMEDLYLDVKEFNDYKGRHVRKYKDSLGK